MAEGKFNVGGVVLDRPFKIRRLGHFGFNLANMEAGRRFYVDLLGFKVSDVMDYSRRATSPEQVAGLGDPNGYFTRYGGDHHAMVLFPKRVRDALGRAEAPGVTINQITWQVGSMREVGMAIQWFNEHGIKQQRSGRDMPGSNWHTYLLDPDGHSNELYYGIEQIGWDGYSKPKSMYDRAFDKPPELPQISEFDEVEQAKAKGIDPTTGFRHVDNLPASFDVDGILLPRPFKIVRLGPVYLFADDMAAAEKFYRQRMGFTLTEEVIWQGHRCLFFRCNTEHHSLALFPTAARAVGSERSQQKRRPRPPARQLPSTQGCRGISTRPRCESHGCDSQRASPRHRSRRPRQRSRRPHNPTLLRHGTDWLGRQTSPQRTAPAETHERLAGNLGGELRRLRRRAVSRSVGMNKHSVNSIQSARYD